MRRDCLCAAAAVAAITFAGNATAQSASAVLYIECLDETGARAFVRQIRPQTQDILTWREGAWVSLCFPARQTSGNLTHTRACRVNDHHLSSSLLILNDRIGGIHASANTSIDRLTGLWSSESNASRVSHSSGTCRSTENPQTTPRVF